MASEADAWLRTALEHLEFAEWILSTNNPHRGVAAALYSALAAEAATSALVIHSGLVPSRTHRNYFVVDRLDLPEEFKASCIRLLRKCEPIIKELTRCPRSSPSGDEYSTPRTAISVGQAGELLQGAKAVTRFAGKQLRG